MVPAKYQIVSSSTTSTPTPHSSSLLLSRQPRPLSNYFLCISVRLDGIMLARSVLRSARTTGNARSSLGRTATVAHPSNPLAPRNKLTPPQRSTTSSSKYTASEAAASPFRLTVAGTATTAVAVGSMAWYYHLFGPTLYAMTPQEEGFVSLRNAQKTRLNMMLGSIQPNTHGNMRNLQRPSTTKRTLLSFSTHYKLY